MNKYIGLVLLVLLCSCKARKPVAGGNSNADKKMAADKIIESYYNNKLDFKTAYIKANARYEDDKSTQNVTAEIRIKKGEIILVSVRFLGITMAKALITPTEVKYYEKLNGKYFEGNYAALSQWLGTDLDFGKVQNLLIGQALDDLKKGSYESSVADKLYKLESTGSGNTAKNFYFESEKFLLKKQEIAQASQQRMLQVIYPGFNTYNEGAMPTGLDINANQKKGKTTINIEYNSVTFNEEMAFPYSVPSSYERIFIN